MKSNILRRVLVVSGVTLFALYLIYPTFRYFFAVSEQRSAVAAGTETSEKLAAREKQVDELRLRSVPLGLDLQGGVDVLLAIDSDATRRSKVEDFSEDLRRRFTRESPSIDATIEVTTGSQQRPIVQATLANANQERAADNILIQMRENGIFSEYQSGSIKAGQKVDLVVDAEALNMDLNNAVESSLKVLRDRVDSLGVTQPVVVKQGTDRIRVQIPGEKDPERALRNIIRPAKLEFRGVYTDKNPGPNNEYRDASASVIDLTTGQPREGERIPYGHEVLPYKRTTRLPDGTMGDQTGYIVVRKKVEMTGEGLKDARVNITQGGLQAGQWEVLVEFSRDGARRFDEISQAYLKRPLAVILDNVVYTAPTVQSRISDGFCQITGDFTQQDATDLSLVLKAGALPAELLVKDRRTVEATLGADSIKTSLLAMLVGSILVAIYMVGYYGVAGLIAIVAVLINVVLVFAFMRLANATLTLSGIGGILLTVGMAVDANILIYERIREEIRSGKTVKAAVSVGFSRAFSVIFDTNLTTMISGLVLLQFGEGTVKGFALALIIGILCTLFTGLYVTRTLVDLWFSKTGTLQLGSFQWFKDGWKYDFVKLRNVSFAISGAVVLGSILYVGAMGTNWGVDFEGGVLAEIETTETKTSQQVQGQFNDWRVQKVAGADHFMVRLKNVNEGNRQIADTQAAIVERLNSTVGEGQYAILSSTAVGNEVGKQFTAQALTAVILGAIFILIYIAFRFEFYFGIAAVVALFHDVIVAYGLFTLFGDLGWAGDFTLDVVSAMLVILGVSINDTIVTLDRVRENMRLRAGESFRDIINVSICETMNRTISTLMTVLVVLVAILIAGGGLFDFALVLFIGMLAGTYSSVFVAAPLLYVFHERQRKKGQSLRLRSDKPAATRGRERPAQV